jgi:hypothetical protein
MAVGAFMSRKYLKGGCKKYFFKHMAEIYLRLVKYTSVVTMAHNLK